MQIDEAIRILKELAEEDEEDHNLDAVEAEKLGIEALGRWQHIRKWDSLREAPLLPGETEE